MLAALAHFLLSYTVLHPDSDPMRWFAYARDFLARFGEVKLAYGFPLVASLAVRIAGPLYGFLVNLPIVLLLAFLVHRFALHHGAPPRLAPGVAGVALMAFIAWNTGDSSMLLRLSNPYRDPLSYVLLLSATLVLFRSAALGGEPWRSALGGALLALACSTRETSVLLLAPLGIYAVVTRLSAADVRFVRPVLCFVLGFAVAILPLLIQNWIVSGSAIVPAQASGTLGLTRTYFSGLGWLYFPETFPRLIAEMVEHYGKTGLALIAVGLAAAAKQRLRVVLFFSAPALVIYTLFYGSYYAIVPRYLFVLDLFAAPIAGCGAVALASALLARVAVRRTRTLARRWLPAAALAGAFGFVLYAPSTEWVRVDTTGPFEERLRIDDVKRLRDDLAALAPAPATLVSERPLSSLLRTFFDYDVTALMFESGNRNLKKRVVVDHIVADLRAVSKPRWYLRPLGVPETPADYVLSTEFDRVPAAELDAATYRLGALYPGVERLALERLEPWSLLETRVAVEAEAAGRQVLSLDVGRLSREPRSYARVRFDGQWLDDRADDQVNHYVVSVDEPGTFFVTLSSDAPLPRVLRASLAPVEMPIELDLRDQQRLAHVTRLSEDFFRDTIPVAPIIDGGAGTIRVPLLEPKGAVFAVLVVLACMGEEDVLLTHHLRAELAGRRVADGPIGAPASVKNGWGWYEKVFTIEGREVADPDAVLDLRVTAPAEIGRPPRPMLVALEIYRFDRDRPFEVEFGSAGDDPFAADGFPQLTDEAIDADLPGRYAGPRARIPVVIGDADQPGRLRVEYLTGLRPPKTPPPSPVFALNGRKLSGRRIAQRVRAGMADRNDPDSVEWGRMLTLLTDEFEVPAALLEGGFATLEITSRPWVPADAGVGGDTRELGVLLHRVRFEQTGANEARGG